jgi:hypothetical protein
MPKKHAAIPPTILIPKYPKKVHHISFLIKLTPSRANVEKVVKAPQKPIATNENKGWSDLMERPINIPINKLPVRFTKSVPLGKLENHLCESK